MIIHKSKLPLPHNSMVGVPFCDYLNISTPKDSGDLLLRALKPHLDIFGLSEVSPGVFRSPYNDTSGTLKYRASVGKVAVLSASGALLKYFRDFTMLPDYLYQISKFDHRVTMLHATADYGLDAPPYISVLHKKALRGAVALTRKRVPAASVKAILSPDQFNRLTGTIYLGNRANADVWAKVYDKRHERLSRGYADIGNMIRVEVAVQSDVGASLRDAYDPAALFYHFASQSLVEAPKDTYPWLPLAEGYTLPPAKPEPTPMARIQSMLDFSGDVDRICSVAVKAFGDEAPALLAVEMRKRAEKQLRGMGQSPHAD